MQNLRTGHRKRCGCSRCRQQQLEAEALSWGASDRRREQSIQASRQRQVSQIQEEIDPETPDHVEWLQQGLNRVQGLRLPTSGVFGPDTRSALRDFQRQRGLDPSGVLTLRTERSLMAAGATPHRHPAGSRLTMKQPFSDSRSKLDEEFRKSAFPAAVQDIYNQGAILWPGAVQRAIEAGIRDLNLLTNLVFFMHHPERMQGDVGKALHSSEPGYSRLAEEWKGWRDLVKLILAKAPASSSTVPSSQPLRLSLVNTRMPKSGPGFTTSANNYKYGVPETIAALKTIAQAWHRRHPDIQLMVRDISRQGGGKFSTHKSHRIGLDADVQLWIGGQKACMSHPNYAKWRPYVEEFVSVILAASSLEVMLIGYSDKRVRSTTYWPGHTCHLHIRFCMPAKYKGQLDLNRVYSVGEKKPSYSC